VRKVLQVLVCLHGSLSFLEKERNSKDFREKFISRQKTSAPPAAINRRKGI